MKSSLCADSDCSTEPIGMKSIKLRGSPGKFHLTSLYNNNNNLAENFERAREQQFEEHIYISRKLMKEKRRRCR